MAAFINTKNGGNNDDDGDHNGGTGHRPPSGSNTPRPGYDPGPGAAPIPGPEPEPGNDQLYPVYSVPATGDNRKMIWWMAFMVTSAAGCVLSLFYKRKAKHEE